MFLRFQKYMLFLVAFSLVGCLHSTGPLYLGSQLEDLPPELPAFVPALELSTLSDKDGISISAVDSNDNIELKLTNTTAHPIRYVEFCSTMGGSQLSVVFRDSITGQKNLSTWGHFITSRNEPSTATIEPNETKMEYIQKSWGWSRPLAVGNNELVAVVFTPAIYEEVLDLGTTTQRAIWVKPANEP